MRALLVVNSFATTTTAEVQSVITSALANHLDLTVINTEEKLHAIEIGQSAAVDRYELVIALGGDGTLNELANGLLNHEDKTQIPCLAGLPGGNANVFVRNLGYSNDPVIATAQLIEKIKENATRSIGLGQVHFDGQKRWFLFNAGVGLDARVLSRMEDLRSRGRVASDLSYALITLKELFKEVRNGKAQIEITDQSGTRYPETQFALIVNFSPWTYIGKYPISPTKRKIDSTSLDLFASYELSVARTAQLIRDLVLRNNLMQNENVLVLEHQKAISLKSSAPTWIQTDGEALALVQDVEVKHFSQCLTVIA